MKFLKNYQIFNESILSKNKERFIEIISSYISRKTGNDLYPYSEIFHIQKSNLFLMGQLMLSLKSSKSIRINWSESDLKYDIHSIDIWNSFTFESDPEYTLYLNDMSVVRVLPDIVDFFNNPAKYLELAKKINNHVISENAYQEKLGELGKKLTRARSGDSKEKIQRQIENLKASIASDEKRQLSSDSLGQDDLDIDVFKAMELNTIQVAKGKSNSLIITGMAGVGKSNTVKETLRSIGMVPDVHFYWSTGTVTTAGLYEVLFRHRNNIVVFDDCDAVFKDPDSVNMLKGALDTYDVREISKLTKGNTFDSTGMSDEEIRDVYEKNPSKLPNKFQFKGQIIFISNLPEDKFDDALISRSLHIDVNLEKSEIIGRMKEIMKKISPDISMSLKEEALEYLIYITDNYPVKFDLNIRTLVHSINLRDGNDDIIQVKDREEVAWKLLIKKYLVRDKKHR